MQLEKKVIKKKNNRKKSKKEKHIEAMCLRKMFKIAP